MPAIPLPFVIALLLIILLVRVLVQSEKALRPTTLFIAACIVLVTTVGLRWTVDLPLVRFLQPVVAALLPPIAWLCFADLRQRSSVRRWPHFLPAVLVLFLSAIRLRWHPPIDPILALLYFGYGLALLRRAYASPDSLESARLSDAAGARRAVLLAGGTLVFSGVVDLLIAADFNFYRGSHVASIIGTANILVLPLVAYAIAIIGRSVPEVQSSGGHQTDEVRDGSPESTVAAPATQDDRRVMEALETAMRERQLFRDPDLTLSRLSRRLGIPSRQISSAINRTLGRNVSQAVNEYRIREAMRLLQETDLTVTAVMFECGFYTKSNFNREFARVAGMTPSDYRRAGAVNLQNV